MTGDRLAWEIHSLDVEQLDLFASEQEEPDGRVYQMTELAGETWEDAFGGAA